MSVHGNQKDAEVFAKALNALKLGEKVKVGKFYLRNTPPAARIIDENDLLGSVHQYVFTVESKTLALSLKIIAGSDGKYRLFAYTKVEDNEGMVMTMDLSTQRAENNIISLMQIIKFTERFNGHDDVTNTDRKQKQAAMTKILTKLGFHVTIHGDLLFGQFDTDTGEFLGTKPDRFLIDIVLVALLKGHLQGNKGFQLEVFDNLE
jgi:hypothetical protein